MMAREITKGLYEGNTGRLREVVRVMDQPPDSRAINRWIGKTVMYRRVPGRSRGYCSLARFAMWAFKRVDEVESEENAA